MSDIDLAVKHAKKLESILRKRFDAQGRGLHELVSSVERELPAELVRRIRLVATVRNKLLHEDGYQRIDDRDRFLRACTDAERQLKSLRKGRRGCLLSVIVMLAIAGAGSLWWAV